MGKLSIPVKVAISRLAGFYVDDVGEVKADDMYCAQKLTFQFDDMDIKDTNTSRNSGQLSRNTLFKLATEAKPVKTITQINFDISGCQKFWPPGLKAYIEMEHVADELRCFAIIL